MVPVGIMTVLIILWGEERNVNEVREADGTVPGRTSNPMVVPVHRCCGCGFEPCNNSNITRDPVNDSIFFVGLSRQNHAYNQVVKFGFPDYPVSYAGRFGTENMDRRRTHGIARCGAEI